MSHQLVVAMAACQTCLTLRRRSRATTPLREKLSCYYRQEQLACRNEGESDRGWCLRVAERGDEVGVRTGEEYGTADHLSSGQLVNDASQCGEQNVLPLVCRRMRPNAEVLQKSQVFLMRGSVR